MFLHKRLGVLKLLDRLQREDDLAVLYLTHDLATAAPDPETRFRQGGPS